MTHDLACNSIENMNSYQWPWAVLARVRTSVDSHQQWLLLCCLLGAGGNSLLFYFVTQPGYNHVANLMASAAFFGMALLVPIRRLHTVLSNLGLLTAVALMAYITACTGGINSPAMVWMTILAVPALLLLGHRWALWWVAAIMITIVMQWVAVTQGWVSGDVDQSPQTILWAVLDKVLVILSLMAAVNFYESLHQRQWHEVEQGNADLEAAQKALLQAQSHKDEFIASVGHELRTPMNAILGLNGVLQTELQDQPEHLKIAEHIRQSTEQLLSLVNDILDFSQLEAGRLKLLEKPVLLAHALHRAVEVFMPRALEKSLMLQLEIDPQLPAWVLVDEQRLRQILNNLLDNAIKFTSQGQIWVRAKALQGRIRFEVQDTGRGIPEDRQQQVFNRFEHADIQTNRAYGGTGLGLAICERLVSLQSGNIGVQSAAGQGALFWFELSLQAASPPSDMQMHALSRSSAKGLRFLLVDDNAVNIMVAKLMLEKCWPDAHVTSAESGEQALKALESKPFDVVLMDMIMPGMDGLETTRILRQNARPEVAQLPVIGLTANTNALDKERCMQSGMNDVLAKPMDIRMVKERVDALFTATKVLRP